MSSLAALRVGVGGQRQGAFCVVGPLRVHPRAEVVAISRVARRDTGVAMALDILQESGETLLPLPSNGIPCPAWQLFQSVLAVGLKDALDVASRG
jgi:hypothetical protein